MADLETLKRGAEEILPEGRLEEQLASGKRLRVKLGIDPSTSDIHLGHVVVLMKLAQFQEAGHKAILIIGDFTARVGDPSGRNTMRPVLSPQRIRSNARTYQDQAFKILQRRRTEVRFNREWLNMRTTKFFRLLGSVTVARLLEREDFSKRMGASEPISALELLYPVLQGYDSVAVDADVELGGTDQKFNLLFARDIQRAQGMPGQSIMTMPILPGTDGKQKMSKSLDNYIGVTDEPEDMFGKLMSIPDTAMPSYYRLLLGEEQPSGSPVVAKRSLARRLVARFHNELEAEYAEARFDQVHVFRGVPADVEDVKLAPYVGPDGYRIHIPLLMGRVFGMSSSEARRLIQQGGVKVDGRVLGPKEFDVDPAELDGRVMRVGKRRFKRLIAA